jgi:MtrB/PioB family decaheme-associated outer membrane protein
MRATKPATLALTLLAASVAAAFAQETPPPPFGGWVSITGIHTDVTSDNRFRFAEYRDLDSGVTGALDLRGQSNAWYYNLFGENLGRDDQFVQLKGGRYGLAKFNVYSDDIIHNLTFGAITPFTGVGTNSLTFTGTAPSTATATWNAFDYSVQHKNVGGAAEAQAGIGSPIYFRVAANRKKSEGIKPLGAAGTSPGGPAYELPAPIDWTTTDVSGEAGYSSKVAHFSVNVLYSKFEDHNDFLTWRTPFVTTGANIESSTLAADSNLRRVGVNGMLKQLPLDSSLALRATYTKITNSMPIGTTFLAISGTTGANRLTNPCSPTFEGEVVNKSFSAAFNSHLGAALSSKVYWNWYERDNNSSHIVFTPSGPGSGGTCDIGPTGAALTTCSTEFLHFKKDNVGVELYYKLARGHKLTFGLDYMDTERERIDFDRSKETKAFVEYKTSAMEVADVRVKYQHLRRKAEFLEGDNPDLITRNFFRFDAAPLNRDTLKVVFDTTPAPLLDLGAEFIVKRNKYKDTLLGRNKDSRFELAFSASYGDPNALRLTAFADYERAQYDSMHWVGATTTFPNTNTAGTTYLWESDVKDRNYLVGAAASWKLSERINLVGSLIWQKANGAVDFAAQSTVANPMNIDRYDNFRKKALNVRGMYAVTRHLDVSLGAAWEKYEYTDIQMDEYIYNIRTGTNQSFLTGAYAFPNYKASIVYATLAYRF